MTVKGTGPGYSGKEISSAVIEMKETNTFATGLTSMYLSSSPCTRDHLVEIP
jgi:hypothetical protein